LLIVLAVVGTSFLLGMLISGFSGSGGFVTSPEFGFVVSQGKAAYSPGIAYPTSVSEGAGSLKEGGDSDNLENSFISGRKIAISATVSMYVENVNESSWRIISIARSLGGYVSQARIGKKSAYITIKVPKDEFWTALTMISKLGEVYDRGVTTQDLTDRIVDLESRLKSLKVEEERLLDLLKRAESISDILKIEDKLSSIRSQIESLEAWNRNLQNQVEYSRISVILSVKKPVGEDIWRVIGDAFWGSVKLLLICIAGGAPFGLSAAGTLYVAHVLYRRRKLRVSSQPSQS